MQSLNDFLIQKPRPLPVIVGIDRSEANNCGTYRRCISLVTNRQKVDSAGRDREGLYKCNCMSWSNSEQLYKIDVFNYRDGFEFLIATDGQ
jgi:hypothetical protein